MGSGSAWAWSAGSRSFICGTHSPVSEASLITAEPRRITQSHGTTCEPSTGGGAAGGAPAAGVALAAGAVNGAVNGETSRIYEIRAVHDNIALKVDFDEA